MYRFISNVRAQHVLYAFNLQKAVNHILENLLVLDQHLDIALEYSALGPEGEPAHIDAQGLGDEERDVIHYSKPVYAFEGQSDRVFLLFCRPVRNHYAVAILAGKAFGDRTGLLVDNDGVVFGQEADYRVSRNRLTALSYAVLPLACLAVFRGELRAVILDEFVFGEDFFEVFRTQDAETDPEEELLGIPELTVIQELAYVGIAL